MATRRRSTATKSAKTIATPVKKTPVKQSPTPQPVVTKYTQPIEIKKVTEETPVKSAPKQPNLSMKDYMDDFKVRWEIHQFETQELWNDLVKGYNLAKPFAIKAYDFSKERYNKFAN